MQIQKSVSETVRSTLSKHFLHCAWSTHNQIPDPEESKQDWNDILNNLCSPSTAALSHRSRERARSSPRFPPQQGQTERNDERPAPGTNLPEMHQSLQQMLYGCTNPHTHGYRGALAMHSSVPPTKTSRDVKGVPAVMGEMQPLGISSHHPQQPTWRRENARSSAKKKPNTPHTSKKPHQTPKKKPKPKPPKTQTKPRFASAHHKPRCQSGAWKSRAGSPNPGENSLASHKDLKSGFKASSLCQYKQPAHR